MGERIDTRWTRARWSLVAVGLVAWGLAIVIGTSEVYSSGELSSWTSDDQDLDDPIEDPIAEHGLAVWETDTDGAAAVRFSLPSSRTRSDFAVGLDCIVRLGALSSSWSQGPYEIAPGETLLVEVEVPEEAFLDELAETYVSSLRVRAQIEGTFGLLDEAVVAWPDGEGGEPVVWTLDTMETEAPYGVLDATVQAEAMARLTDARERLGAPVFGAAARGLTETAEPSGSSLVVTSTDEDRDGE